LAVFFISKYLPGVHLQDYKTAFIVALALSFLNTIVKPILTILTIPITIISLGLFLVVINAAMVMLAQHYVQGFVVDGFLKAIIFSVLLSISTSILNVLFGVKD
jgi:putative membrane protein